MSSPYSTPAMNDALPEIRAREKFWGRMTVLGVILLIAGPAYGLIRPLIGMKDAFASLGTSGADVGALANHIGELLVSTVIGLLFGGLVGLPILILAIVKAAGCRKARRELGEP